MRRDSGLETTGRRLKTVTNPRQVRQGPRWMMGPMLETATIAPIAFSSRRSFRWKFAEEKPDRPAHRSARDRRDTAADLLATVLHQHRLKLSAPFEIKPACMVEQYQPIGSA